MPITELHICPICKLAYSVGICRKCGSLVDNLDNKYFMCPPCLKESRKKYADKYMLNNKEEYLANCLRASQRKADRIEKLFDDWVAQFKKIPTPYATLTEEEWLKTCLYFGGCAYCGAAAIEAREYFIPFNRGGQYTVWNIVPLCADCANVKIYSTNPWKRFNGYYHKAYAKKKLTKEGFDKIVDYLQDKIKEAIECTQNPEKTE